MSISIENRLSASHFLKAGIAAVLAAVLANIVARFLLGLLVPLSPDFQPFSYGSIIAFTVIFTAIGLGVLALVNRLSRNPIRTFNIIALAAFIVSILPNLAAAANPDVMPMGGRGSDYLTLIYFHVIATVSFLGVLNYAARKA